MLPMLFLMIAGAWHAWRRNPSYSTRATLQYLGATVLMVATVLTLDTVIFDHTQKSSPGLGIFLVMVTVFLAVVGFSMTVIRISSGHAPPLPPAVTIGHTQRRKVRRWAEHIGLALLFVATPGFLAPRSWGQAFFTLAGFFLFVSAIALWPLYYQAGLGDRRLAALEANPWIHWQFTPAQWQEWIDAQVARLQATPPTFVWKRDWRKPLLVVAVTGPVGALYGYGWRGILGFMGGIAGLLLIINALMRWSARREPRALRRRLAATPPEVYAGPDGLYCQGEYTSWVLSGNYLTEVRIDERAPRSLVFEFNKMSGYQTFPVAKSCPIPGNAEPDIALLQQRLSAQCPKAIVRIAARYA